MEKNISINHHNRTVAGVYYLPDTDNKVPVVIFSHGYNGSGNDFADSARELNRHGIGAVCYDFCGGSVNSRSTMATTDMTIFTEKEDLMAVLDYVKNSEEADSKQIYLFGGSQGGLVTALTAEERTADINGLLLLYPALCIPHDWRKTFPDIETIPESRELWGMALGKNFFVSIHDLEVFDYIGRFPKKTLIMHGDKDDIALIEFSQKALSMYPDARLEVFEGEGHGFSDEGNKKMTQMVIDFINSSN